MADAYIGEIRLFAGSFAPLDWMFCEGQTLRVQQYSALYAVLGNIYGGQPGTTLCLPDLRGRAPLQYGAGPGLTRRDQGQTGGSSTVTLTEAQMAAHTHSVGATTTAPATNSPAGAIWAAGQGFSAKPMYGTAPDATTVMNNAIVSRVGGGQPHENMQPYLGVRYIICINGIFPDRP